MPLELVQSERGFSHLVHLGYRYLLHKKGESENIWYCVENRTAKCRGRAYTAENEILRIFEEHNHTPDSAKIEVLRIRTKIKIASVKTSEPPQVIVAACTQGISASVLVQLPSVRAMKRTVRKDRVKAGNPYPLPSSLLTLQIPDVYQKAVTEENFLLFDSGNCKNRILMYGTMKNLQHMENASEWFADGIFKVAPLLFDQLYTIHVVRFNKVFPAVYALLPDRTDKTYTHMLDELKKLSPNLKPRSIMTDFERAAKNSFRRAFPSAVQSGCLFHFGQCFWRKIQKLPQVAKSYVEDPDFALKIKCLTALAFVPPAAVKDAFEILTTDEFCSSSAEMESLIDYVETNWIGGFQRGRARPPKFAVHEWNCYQRVADNAARTNNAVEGWHRAFQSQLGAAHPSLWKFIETVKQQQSLNELLIEQHLGGHDAEPPRKKYRDLSDRLKSIVGEYDQRPIVDYLTGIAHNLTLNA